VVGRSRISRLAKRSGADGGYSVCALAHSHVAIGHDSGIRLDLGNQPSPT
jgi:hypothetical protein